MEKYFTTIDAFACKHGNCFTDERAKSWLMKLEEKPLVDQHALYETDRVNFNSLKIIFRKRWDITEKEFDDIYETWKKLVDKHGYNPFKGRDSVTYQQNKKTVVKEAELNKLKKLKLLMKDFNPKN